MRNPEEICNEADDLTVRISEAIREWSGKQGHPPNQTLFALAIAISSLTEGQRIVAREVGASAILALSYGDKVADVRDLLQYAVANLDALIAEGTN